MRKNLLYAIAWVVLSSLFISCNDDDTVTSINPDKIARFAEPGAEIIIPENSESVYEIPVYINYDSPNEVKVYYEIEGDSSVYELVSQEGYAAIPAGQRTGKILIKAVDNNDFNDPVNSVVIRITGSDGEFGAPSGVAIDYAEKVITFEDDDCLPPVYSSYTATVYAFDAEAPSYEATLSQVDENTYAIDSAWGPNFVAWATGNSDYEGLFPYAGQIVIDINSLSVSVSGDNAWATGGSGITTCEGVISYTLTQDLFTTDFTVDVVLTPNN